MYSTWLDALCSIPATYLQVVARLSREACRFEKRCPTSKVREDRGWSALRRPSSGVAPADADATEPEKASDQTGEKPPMGSPGKEYQRDPVARTDTQ